MPNINVKHAILELHIADLKPWSENPRGIEQESIEGLRASLENFGLVDFPVVNKRNMQVISGHQRIKVLQADGIEVVPCVMVDLDDMAAQTLAITLNNQEIAGYFTAALIPILEQMRKEMPEDYIKLRLQELREEVDQFEVEKTGNTLPDDIPPAPKETITKTGDLWILGDHRLLCGSSTSAEDIASLMDGLQAQLLATDPPYLVDYTGKDRPGGGKDWSDTYHEVDIKDARGFFHSFLSLALRNIDQNTAIYVWHADRRFELINDIFRDLDILLHQHIIWVKPCTVMTYSIYPWRHEPCLFGWRRGSKPFFRPSRKKIGSVWVVDLLRTGDPEGPEYYSDLWEVDWEVLA
jgi:hypothetical protein